MADALVIRGLSKRFGGLRAVQEVSFTVKENETVALIGPNGAGKTTSFNLITGFHRPDAGSVLAYGREIVGLKPHDICAHGLARTFQVAKPFGAMTVLSNVMTGAFLRDKNMAAARDKAREAIEFVGLSAREQTAAKDLTTIDQRRLEMARALATEPRLLVLFKCVPFESGFLSVLCNLEVFEISQFYLTWKLLLSVEDPVKSVRARVVVMITELESPTRIDFHSFCLGDLTIFSPNPDKPCIASISPKEIGITQNSADGGNLHHPR